MDTRWSVTLFKAENKIRVLKFIDVLFDLPLYYNSRRFDLPIRSVFHLLRLSLQLRRLGYILYIYLQLILLYVTDSDPFDSWSNFFLTS